MEKVADKLPMISLITQGERILAMEIIDTRVQFICDLMGKVEQMQFVDHDFFELIFFNIHIHPCLWDRLL